MSPDLSLVIPLHNEHASLEPLYRRLSDVLATMEDSAEIVFVNDGSSDASLSTLLALQAADSRIRVVDLSRNFGKEAALSAGLEHARGAAVVPLDADLQDPPELIPEMVRLWRRNACDVVYAVREDRSADSLAKRISARLFYRLFNALSRQPIPHDAGDFRLLDRRVVEVLRALPERNRFMKGLFAWVGFRQQPLPYRRERRAAGQSRWTVHGLTDLALDALTAHSAAPLRAVGIAGGIIALVAFCYAAFLVIRTLVLGVDVPGYASIMVSVLFLGGLQLLCLAVLAEYLGRILIEVKGRPLYVVQAVYEPGSSSARSAGASTERERANSHTRG